MASDDLLDFFDLGKKFERVAIFGGQTRGRIRHGEAALQPPPLEDEDEGEDAEEEGGEYWVKYKEEEERTMQIRRRLEEAEVWGKGRGGADICPQVETEFYPLLSQSSSRPFSGAHMSGLEADTLEGTVLGPGPGAREEKPLVEMYDFYDRSKTGEKKLFIHEEKERIVDLIQVQGFKGPLKLTYQ